MLMDHELIAHLNSLSSLEMNATAEKQTDIQEQLWKLWQYLIDIDELDAARVVHVAISEISILRKETE
jgi:Asp-tRNA(Asn)/Glu-tRNA(Gln) amidotransferase C subunit